MDTHQLVSKYWIESTNRLLSKLGIDTIQPEEFTNLIVHTTDDHITNITVICTNKMLVISVNGNKITGGWKVWS